MVTEDLRKLAHQMLDNLDEEELAKIIFNMRQIKKQKNIKNENRNIPSLKPTSEELYFLKKGKDRVFYSHKDVFGE